MTSTTWQLELMKQELLTPPEHTPGLFFLGGVRVTQSFVF